MSEKNPMDTGEQNNPENTSHLNLHEKEKEQIKLLHEDFPNIWNLSDNINDVGNAIYYNKDAFSLSSLICYRTDDLEDDSSATSVSVVKITVDSRAPMSMPPGTKRYAAIYNEHVLSDNEYSDVEKIVNDINIQLEKMDTENYPGYVV